MNHYSQTLNSAKSDQGLEPSRLWFEVIMQGLREILDGNVEAKAWLYSDDFEACCARAGAQNMQGIRDLIEQALQTPPPVPGKKTA